MKLHINIMHSNSDRLSILIIIISMVVTGLAAPHSVAAGHGVKATQDESRVLKKLGSRTASKQEPLVLKKVPRLQVKLLSGDFESWGSEKVIYQPELLELAWGKPLSSDFATWKLAAQPFPTNNILASGTVSNSGGEWGLFQVNLAGRIPSTPPDDNVLSYYIKVFPASRSPTDSKLPPTSIVKIIYKKDNNITYFYEEMVDHEVEVTVQNGGHGFNYHDLEAKVDEWLCALTKIGGPFHSSDEQVRLYPNSKGNWVLSVKSKHAGVFKAKATCTRWGYFILQDGRRAVGGNTQVGEFQLVAPDDGRDDIDGVPVFPSSCTSLQNVKNLWSRTEVFHPMCFISGMSGLFVSKDERISIFSQGSQYVMEVRRCVDGWSKGYALCAYTGSEFYSPNAPQIQFTGLIGPDGEDYVVDLMPVDKGFCTLQEIQGGFDQSTFVELVRSSDGWWKLIGSPGNVRGEDRLQALALCYHWSHPAHPSELP